MKRRVTAAAAALGLMAAGASAQSGEDIEITLVPGLTTDPFYITMNHGAQDAAEDLGVTVNFQGPEEFDPVRQVPVLNAVISRGPDAILIAPTDKTQLIAPLKKADQADIPVITLDTFIGDGEYQDGSGEGDFPLSYIASNNVQGGRMAARAMVDAIGGEGKVYVSNVRPGISTTDQREQGFREVIEETDGVTLLETQYNEDDSSLAASQLQAVLARNPDLAGVFGANLFSAIGSANGVRQAGKSDQITVVAFDAPKSVIDRIESGLVDMVIAQHPAEIGYFGVMAAYAHLHGHSIPRQISTGFTVITEDNYQDEDIQKFFYSE